MIQLPSLIILLHTCCLEDSREYIIILTMATIFHLNHFIKQVVHLQHYLPFQFDFAVLLHSLTIRYLEMRYTRSVHKIMEHFELQSILVTRNWQHCVRHNLTSNQMLMDC